MMKTSMLALALALVAPAAFSQASAPAPSAKAHKKPATSPAASGQIKVLRGEIKGEIVKLSAKAKTAKSERQELVVQERAELAKVKTDAGTKAERKSARQAVRRKYAQLFNDAHEKLRSERRMLREDIKAKRALISKLRQS